jgi:hypothetical protein
MIARNALVVSFCLKAIAATAVVLAMCPNVPAAGKRTIVGTIRDHECGDNCYLTIVDARGKKQVALCAAPLCDKIDETPNRFVGRKVKVTVTKGTAGPEERPYPAFSKIELLRGG